MGSERLVAQFCIEVGEAMTRFGRALDVAASVADVPRTQLATPSDGGRVLPNLIARVSGSRQKETLAVPGLEREEGCTTAQVHAHLNRSINDEPNTNTTLHRLVQLGLVEIVPGAEPRRWRLIAEWRRLFREAGAA